MMAVHQGSYLSDAVFYTTFLFILFLPLYYTGVSMLNIRRRLGQLTSTPAAYELTTADESTAELEDTQQLMASAATPTRWQEVPR